MLALGFQAVADPPVTSIAAMFCRVCPPMPPNSPPAYTTLPLTARAETVPYALGSQAVASPVVTSSAAIRLRAWPPTFRKSPPA